jgi:ATP-dependent helicase HrpB
MMLAAAAWQTRLDTLPLFDPPKPYAVTAARDELVHLGAIDASDALTPLGVALRGLPIDAPLARLLVEARRTDCLEDAIDLVSALAIGKPLFLRDAPMGEGLREGNCDATALIRLVRLRGHADGVAFSTLEEARRVPRASASRT